MAQDSANVMAAAGASHGQILDLFYPGTGRGQRSSAIRVAVWEAGAPTGAVTVTVPGGARVSSDGAAAQAPPGAVLQISADATGFHVRQVPVARGSVVRSGLLADPSPSPSDDPLTGALPSPTASPDSTASPSPSPSGPSATAAPGPSPRPSPPGGSPPPASASPSAAASPSAQAGFTFDSRTPVTLTPAGGAALAVTSTGRSYRGSLVALSREGFRLVNVLDIEDYLRGLGEVPASWPMAALRTQAVAARTYALRAVGAGQPLGYDVCDDTRCQVYLGIQGESSRTSAAARDTRGEVVTYRGALADTFYSANAGGITASPAEGFGGSVTLPYLPAGTPAPGDVKPWRLTLSPQDVAGRLGYAGRLESISVVAKGPSGRATRVRLDGAAGPVELGGVTFQRRLGLRSNLFTVARTTGTAGALPAAASADIQLAPSQAAAAPALPEPSASPSRPPLRTAAPEPALAAVADVEDLPGWLLGTAVTSLTVAAAALALDQRGVLRRVRRSPEP
jgi:SpoIID/LytB domain protein